MELRPSFQIPTLIKALTDVVLPAVDPNNKLAQEQAQLIIGSLQLIAQRMPLQTRYDRHEIAGFIGLAEQLLEAAGGTPALTAFVGVLAESAATARAVLQRPGLEPVDLETTNLALREAISRLVQAASALPDTLPRTTIESAVMKHAEQLLLCERSWLSAQGWEGKNPAIPPIEALLGK